PDYLEQMVGLIERYPEAGIYAGSYYKVKQGKHISAKIGVEPNFKEGYFDYFMAYAQSLWMPVWTGAAIVSRKAFDSVSGFNAKLTLGEDFDLWVRIALQYKTVLINKPLAYYNQDVDITQRGVINNKIYKPEEFFLFNLSYLELRENKNPNIKSMLDRLRVYTLKRYRIQNAYPEHYKREIAKVDFSKQAFKMWLFYYFLPPFLLRIFRHFVNKAF
ncbi:MAG: hypothetical protein JXQ69_08870, partial [Paludibacteraceae bacterium]|nr:hypothetical protein [Paludibacteraceae bacterium]